MMIKNIVLAHGAWADGSGKASHAVYISRAGELAKVIEKAAVDDYNVDLS